MLLMLVSCMQELKSQLRSCVDDNLNSLDIVHTLSGRVDQASAHIEALEHANQVSCQVASV